MDVQKIQRDLLALGPWPRLTKGNGQSPLEKQLKATIKAIPNIEVHPHSPSGPFVHAVLFTGPGGIVGNAHQTTPTPGSGWTARAFVSGVPRSYQEAATADFHELPGLITQLVTDAGKLR